MENADNYLSHIYIAKGTYWDDEVFAQDPSLLIID